MLNTNPQSATISLDSQKPCPCGSNTAFADCCSPRLTGARPARTAEQLMRSRYTAHVVCDVDYLVKTWKAPDPRSVNPNAIRQWAQESDWCGLVIHDTTDGNPDDPDGWVEFSAFYRTPETAPASSQSSHRTPSCQHREKSHFVQIDDLWYYVEGETVDTSTSGAKPGRNTPCPCGSGKKFKRCCGA